ncbi:histone, partial [Massilia buxea]|nr:histone [Pseudoduganella buxea]
MNKRPTLSLKAKPAPAKKTQPGGKAGPRPGARPNSGTAEPRERKPVVQPAPLDQAPAPA